HPQEPNLVRLITTIDGSQTLYEALEDHQNPNRTCYRQKKSAVTRVEVDGAGVTIEVDRAASTSAACTTATFVPRAKYENTSGFISRVIDAFGKIRFFTRDQVTKGIIGVQARGDTTPITIGLNQFLQPTKTVDRLGRVTTAMYDAFGKVRTITHAVGTPD